MHADLISSVPELCQDIRRQHPGIAACDINIGIGYLHQTEHCVNKTQFCGRIVHIWVLYFRDKLDLVNEHIVTLAAVRDLPADILVQFDRVAVSCIVQRIKRKPDDLFRCCALAQQIIPVKLKKQYGFSASSKPCDDFDSAVVLFPDQLIKVLFSRIHLFHLAISVRIYAKIFCVCCVDYIIFYAASQELHRKFLRIDEEIFPAHHAVPYFLRVVPFLDYKKRKCSKPNNSGCLRNFCGILLTGASRIDAGSKHRLTEIRRCLLFMRAVAMSIFYHDRTQKWPKYSPTTCLNSIIPFLILEGKTRNIILLR